MAGHPEAHRSQPTMSPPTAADPTTTNTAPTLTNLPSLRAAARAAAEQRYSAGPGRDGEGCPRAKKARSAYISRFQARAYEAMLKKHVEATEAEVGELRERAGRLAEERRGLEWEAACAENKVLRRELERLQDVVRAGGGVVDTGLNEVLGGAGSEEGEDGDGSGAFQRASSGSSLGRQSIGGDSDISGATEVAAEEAEAEEVGGDRVGLVWGMEMEVVDEEAPVSPEEMDAGERRDVMTALVRGFEDSGTSWNVGNGDWAPL